MKKFTLSALLLGAALNLNAQKEYTLFEDDFSWLMPWAQALNASGQACGDPIGKNSTDENVTVSRALNNIKLDVDGTEISADKEMTDKGYTLLLQKQSSLSAKPVGNTVYLQRSLNSDDEVTGVYFKFGLTGYTSGLTTPAITNIGDDGVTGVKVTFYWTPVRQGSGTYDKTHLSVLVNDQTTVGQGRINIPDLTLAKDSEYEWHYAEADFGDYVLRDGDKISIRPGANQWPGGATAAFRYYLKDLKITCTTPLATGVADIETDSNAPIEYYNLQGMKVTDPENGLYIVRQGNKVSKKFIRK